MITLNVNGQSYTVNVSTDTPLLWALRDVLGLTGTKYGCGIQRCWGCSVLIDGRAQLSCDISAGEAVGHTITTIEGLAASKVGPYLQQAWVTLQVPQCGFCQSGMLMQAAALLQHTPNPADSDINDALYNICICGTYSRVRAAIKLAAANLAAAGG